MWTWVNTCIRIYIYKTPTLYNWYQSCSVFKHPIFSVPMKQILTSILDIRHRNAVPCPCTQRGPQSHPVRSQVAIKDSICSAYPVEPYASYASSASYASYASWPFHASNITFYDFPSPTLKGFVFLSPLVVPHLRWTRLVCQSHLALLLPSLVTPAVEPWSRGANASTEIRAMKSLRCFEWAPRLLSSFSA